MPARRQPVQEHAEVYPARGKGSHHPDKVEPAEDIDALDRPGADRAPRDLHCALGVPAEPIGRLFTVSTTWIRWPAEQLGDGEAIGGGIAHIVDFDV